MKRRVIDKGISAVGTVLFVGLIQTDAPAWQLLILFVFLYELAQELCRTMRREAMKNRKKHYITVTRRGCPEMGRHTDRMADEGGDVNDV